MVDFGFGARAELVMSSGFVDSTEAVGYASHNFVVTGGSNGNRRSVACALQLLRHWFTN